MATTKHTTNAEALYHYGASDFKLELLEKFPLNSLLEWSQQEENGKLAFRSAWALEHILLGNTALFDGLQTKLMEGFCQLANWSALRSYSKLLMYLSSDVEKVNLINEDQAMAIIEKCFGILENSDCPVAVKVNVMDILYAFIARYDWIKNELRLLIELELEKEATPALRSRGAKILKRILKS